MLLSTLLSNTRRMCDHFFETCGGRFAGVDSREIETYFKGLLPDDIQINEFNLRGRGVVSSFLPGQRHQR